MGLTFSDKRRRRSGLRVLIALLVIVTVAVVGTVVFISQVKPPGPPPLPNDQATAFLAAWSAADTAGMTAQLEKPLPDISSLANSLVKSAPGSHAQYTLDSLTRDKKGGGATATYDARVNLAGFGPFGWKNTLKFVRVKTGPGGKTEVWRIRLAPGDLYPGLTAGQHLVLDRAWPSRASIVASDGSILAGSQGIVRIGVEPDRIAKTLPQIKKLMKQLVGTDAATIDAALHGPGVRPNYFVEIAQVPDDTRYATVLRPKLAPINGVFFQHDQGVVAPAGVLSPQLLGTVGEITAERLKQLGPPYRVGDLVGLGGLQQSLEGRLAGRPTGTVVLQSATKPLRTLKTFPGRIPAQVALTIDPHVQSAANTALAGVTGNAALVAVDTATGRIRAVVSKPDNGFDRALDGAYPPGSTFKVITSTALLAAGRTGSTPAPCPATLTVDGKKFTNFEGEASGATDLADAFKISCNNSFIGLADQLSSKALPDAATLYGFNKKYSLPLAAYGGTFPTPKDRAEQAASAIGQGRILASPLQMASVAAAVASGQWHAPSLTTEPATPAVTAPALDPDVAATLREFMASVPETGGTAAGAGLPPGTFGKTGTAEFGSGNPPQTHAWFIGYRGNLAFAVIVEGGGVGGRVAAPLAAKFLDAL
jgi:cell division protein FtsI/penicillin-binding protein 2